MLLLSCFTPHHFFLKDCPATVETTSCCCLSMCHAQTCEDIKPLPALKSHLLLLPSWFLPACLPRAFSLDPGRLKSNVCTPAQDLIRSCGFACSWWGGCPSCARYSTWMICSFFTFCPLVWSGRSLQHFLHHFQNYCFIHYCSLCSCLSFKTSLGEVQQFFCKRKLIHNLSSDCNSLLFEILISFSNLFLQEVGSLQRISPEITVAAPRSLFTSLSNVPYVFLSRYISI